MAQIERAERNIEGEVSEDRMFEIARMCCVVVAARGEIIRSSRQQGSLVGG